MIGKTEQEKRRNLVRLASILVGFIVFILVCHFCTSLSRSCLAGLAIGGYCGLLTSQLLPIYILGRLDPKVYNPKEEVFELSPGDVLGELTKSLKILRFQGKAWLIQDTDELKNQLVYSLKFDEQSQTKEGRQIKNFELLLQINTYQDPRSADLTFVRLNFWETQRQLSIFANEIVLETTKTIYDHLRAQEATHKTVLEPASLESPAQVS